VIKIQSAARLNDFGTERGRAGRQYQQRRHTTQKPYHNSLAHLKAFQPLRHKQPLSGEGYSRVSISFIFF